MPTVDDLRAALNTLRAATPADLARLGHALVADYENAAPGDDGPTPAPLFIATTALAGRRYLAAAHSPQLAAKAVSDAVTRAADDLDLHPDLLAAAEITVMTGPGGTVFRDGHTYS